MTRFRYQIGIKKQLKLVPKTVIFYQNLLVLNNCITDI